MKKNTVLILSLCVFSLAFAFSADAEEAVPQEPVKVETKVKTTGDEKAETPVTKLEDLTNSMMDGLDEEQLKQFAAIRLAHGVLRSVKEVQSSVGRAVTACVEENPTLKDSMETRFRSWKSAIRPVLKKGEDRVAKMIILQDYAKPSEVRSYLTSFDEAIAYREKNIEKKPVTEKASCEAMLEKMDETQERLLDLMKESLGLDQPLTKSEKTE